MRLGIAVELKFLRLYSYTITQFEAEKVKNTDGTILIFWEIIYNKRRIQFLNDGYINLTDLP